MNDTLNLKFTDGKLGAFPNCEPLVERRQRVENRQAGANRTLAIVFVRLWITEIDDQTVAQVLVDVPAEACNGLGCETLVLPGYVAPIFGVETGGNFSRVDEIAKQHRQMAALSLAARERFN